METIHLFARGSHRRFALSKTVLSPPPKAGLGLPGTACGEASFFPGRSCAFFGSQPYLAGELSTSYYLPRYLRYCTKYVCPYLGT